MKDKVNIVDMFCGGGGESTGLIEAAHDYNFKELEKEAKEYALEWGDKTDGTYACCRDGYLAGAEPREKRIAELEAQIEKLIDFVLSKTECCDVCPITALASIAKELVLMQEYLLKVKKK